MAGGKASCRSLIGSVARHAGRRPARSSGTDAGVQMHSKRLRNRFADRRTWVVLAATAGMVTASMLGVGGSSAIASSQPAYLDQHASPAARATDLVGRMTLAQKIGQMTQTEVSRIVGNCNYGPGPLNTTCAQQILGDE